VGDKIEKNEMGGACSAVGEGEIRVTGFWWGNRRERDHWGDPGVDGTIILGWIFRSSMWDMEWIWLAEDRVWWQAIVNAVMNFRVPLNAGNFLTSYKPVSFSRRTLLHGISNSGAC
jgi:hypothetical protein